MRQTQRGLQSRPVYSRLSYRWHLFGVHLGHVGIALLPACAWACIVAFASPEAIDGSWQVAGFVAFGGAAILDAFGPLLLPDVPRPLRAVWGAVPGAALLVVALLPLPVRAALPMWPALPAGAGLLVAIIVWQWRRPAHALGVALRWQRAPRRFHAGIRPPPRQCAPLPLDVSFHPLADAASAGTP